MLDLRHISLAAVFVLTTGMTGCNDNTNSLDTNTTVAKSNAAGEANLPTETVDRAVATIKAYALDNTKTAPTPTDYTNAGITGVNATNVASVNAQLDNLVFLFTDDVVTKVQAVVHIINGDTTEILKKIGNEHQDHNSIITVAELQAITPALENINSSYENIYRTYIASADSNISSPATRAEVQTMIDDVNALNLPEHAIVDRSFFKKTNGAFQHKFVYLPVTNPKTGRTWLNNNLGAEYADTNSSYFNPSQQATTSSDHLAYGSLFQWGRKADGHELIDWSEDGTTGEPLYGTTTTTADDPLNSLWIIGPYDWRVHRDNTLWASESTPNNVCPVGYRLPLNPNGVSDGENEWFVEMSTWSTPDANGSMSSDLKLSSAGHRYFYNGQMKRVTELGEYWTGSYFTHKAFNMYFGEELKYNDYSERESGLSVRCIKDQTPAERSDSILLEIENEHNKHNSVITVAQLKAITPALSNIDDDKENSYRFCIANSPTIFSTSVTRDDVQSMINFVNTSMNDASVATLARIGTQHSSGSSDITVAQLKAISLLNNIQDGNEKWYQNYIENADTHFSSPATLDELQSMIDKVNALNLPDNAILDRNFYKKTNGKFEHRFVYFPVTNPNTGRTWLNNNLGAEYANKKSSDYNPSQQATSR